MFRDAGFTKNDAVKQGLRIALEAMSAVERGGPNALPSLEAPLPMTDHQISATISSNNVSKSTGSSRNIATFKDLVERTISAAGGWMQALGRSHSTSGKALFKVSASAGSSGGVLIYLDEGVLFFEDREHGGKWRPIGIDDLLEKMAKK